MKYLLFGDIHGADLSPLLKIVDSENVDAVFCLGDFDQVTSIRQFMELESDFLNDGKTVVVVPGNHDYAVLNFQRMHSPVFDVQKKTLSGLHFELERDALAREYISSLLDVYRASHDFGVKKYFLDEDTYGLTYPTTIIHGAFDGSKSSSPDGGGRKMKTIWTRLLSLDDYKKNFLKMKSLDYNVMLRGHDHDRSFAYTNDLENIVIKKPEFDDYDFSLHKDDMSVINPGAYFSGHFAFITTGLSNTSSPSLTFHHLHDFT